MSAVSVAARAYGIHTLDGVFNDPTDRAGLEAELREAIALGYSGKTLIHPSQIDPTHAAFKPTSQELEWANAVVQAMNETTTGVAVVNGKMVEELHARQARLILSRQ
jgi:citrate lyase subunit beta/citryl-CoA lyase